MTLQLIRAHFETQVTSAFNAIGVPVVFDNVQEEPPGQEYVVFALSYDSFAEPQLCPENTLIELIQGTASLICYAPRGQGMGRIEQMATVGMQAFSTLQQNALYPQTGARMINLSGPTPVTQGEQPYVLVNVSGAFRARPDPTPPVGEVNSLHGRTGDVVAEEGDYNLDLMGDVTTGTSPAPGQFLDWDNNQWRPTPSIDSEDF